MSADDLRTRAVEAIDRVLETSMSAPMWCVTVNLLGFDREFGGSR